MSEWNDLWLPEAEKDFQMLDGSQKILVRKAIRKVLTNPLPTTEGGYGKPLSGSLKGLCKIKLRQLGVRIVYRPIRVENAILIIIAIPEYTELLRFNPANVAVNNKTGQGAAYVNDNDFYDDAFYRHCGYPFLNDQERGVVYKYGPENFFTPYACIAMYIHDPVYFHIIFITYDENTIIEDKDAGRLSYLADCAGNKCLFYDNPDDLGDPDDVNKDTYYQRKEIVKDFNDLKKKNPNVVMIEFLDYHFSDGTEGTDDRYAHSKVTRFVDKSYDAELKKSLKLHPDNKKYQEYYNNIYEGWEEENYAKNFKVEYVDNLAAIYAFVCVNNYYKDPETGEHIYKDKGTVRPISTTFNIVFDDNIKSAGGRNTEWVCGGKRNLPGHFYDPYEYYPIPDELKKYK